MDSLIETFHIDIKLLIAQIINFAIVISVLYFFALKPLMKTMDERGKKIEKSLSDAEKIDAKLEKTDLEYKKVIINAKKDANGIIEKAQEQAESKKAQMIIRAKEEIGQIINAEKAKIQQEKAVVLKEIKSEVANLVVASVEKILDKKIDSKEDKELIKKIIK